MTQLWQPWSLRTLVEDLARGDLSVRDVMARTQARIEATDNVVRAWVEPPRDPKTDAAAGPLTGVPIGVKDIIDLAGYPTRCGSRLRAHAVPAEQDAAITAAWRLTGAVPLGKTVTTEFAFFDPGPTRNPAAPQHTPGGSSSGSAAAVAAGQVPLALGSQTAGSVTRPAAYCGVAALVMSHERFPTTGVTGLSPSLDSHGVYAAHVDDLAVAWAALTSSPVPASLTSPLRVLVWQADPLEVVDDEMRTALTQATDALRASGAAVDDCTDEMLFASVARAHPVLMAYEAARERAAELSVASQLSDQLANLLRTGADTSDRDADAARVTIEAGRRRLSTLLEFYDIVLGPAAPSAAPRGLEATGDPVLSRPWQAMGMPQVSIPALRSAAGLPLGLQAIGRFWGETDLLVAAHRVEVALRQ